LLIFSLDKSFFLKAQFHRFKGLPRSGIALFLSAFFFSFFSFILDTGFKVFHDFAQIDYHLSKFFQLAFHAEKEVGGNNNGKTKIGH